ncbi:MAG: DUF484 family protein [Magnetococcales bacterium]|nr:DUF484 family protein [Magnetococcales bacterium]
MDADLTLQEDLVYKWLKDNPEFFNNYPDILPAAITVSGKVLSLEAGQLKKLQKQNEKLSDKLEDILKRLHRNDEIHKTYHEIQISLLTATTPQELIKVTTKSTEDQLSVGRITVAINTSEKDITDLYKNLSEDFPLDRLFFIPSDELSQTLKKPAKPVIRVGLEGNNRNLFFGDHSDKIRSEALVPLFSHPNHERARLIGSLNIGDPSPSRFLPSDSTELLQDLADVLGLCLNRLANCTNIKPDQ